MNILDAMADPALFEPHFRPPSTWAAWRVLLAAAFGLPMDAEGLETFRKYTGRTTAPVEPAKEVWLIVGRRGGKSRILGTIAVFLACFRDYTAHLAPGEVATVAIIAADRRQARAIFRFITGLMKAIPMLARLIASEGAEILELTNRVTIEIHTASFRATRGYSYAAVLGDEAAFWRSDDTSANVDEEILNAVRPGLASIPGSILLVASSPYAKRGALYKAFRKHYGQDGSKALVWKASTAEMNPSLPASEIERAYEDDPARASAEYGATFRDDIAAFVAREVIEGCTIPDRRELPWMPGVLYKAFTDPSGGSADSMTLAIAHEEGEVAILDAVREVRPPFSPDAVVAEFCELLKAYRLTRVSGDRYGGEWPREKFREYGISYDLSDRPKSDIYRDTLPLLNSGSVELLDLPRLAAQFCGLERRTARGGRDSIDHSPGAHDDLANAVAGALLLAGKPAPRPAYTRYVDFSSR